MKTLRELILLVLALLLVAVPTYAGPGPEGFVKAKQGELTVLLKQAKSSAPSKDRRGFRSTPRLRHARERSLADHCERALG